MTKKRINILFAIIFFIFLCLLFTVNPTAWLTSPGNDQDSAAPKLILKDIYLVSDQNAYLIKTNAGLALVDSGVKKRVPELMENVKKLGLEPLQIKWIINTHAHQDHVGGNEEVKALTGASIYIHKEGIKETSSGIQEGSFVPVISAHAFEDRDIIEIGEKKIYVIHTPGHTPDSCCFLLRLQTDSGIKNLLFTGDVIFAGGTLGWVDGNPNFQKSLYLKSIHKLIKLEIAHEKIRLDVLLPGHGGIVEKDVYQCIKSTSDNLNALSLH